MDKPELYNEYNTLTTVSTKQCLDEYTAKIKWKDQGGSIIDLGCGDGGVTSLINEYIPNNYKFVACDISDKMVKFARNRYGDENIVFRVLDAEGDIPDDMRRGFDHVFSFFLFHWIRNQEKAFQNVYDLLKEGGDCMLTFFGYSQVYELYDIIGRDPKWSSTWIKNLNDFISPYYNMKDPEKKITEMLKGIGFKNIDVHQRRNMQHVFENGEKLKSLLRAVDPYGMPADVHEDFMRDFVVAGQNTGLFNKTNKIDMADIKDGITFKYCLIVVYATK